jgi:PBP1b-binding outer membrane lipoprotein LpoB
MTTRRLTLPALLLSSLALLPACSSPSYNQQRPDPSTLITNDTGIQSKDITEMTDKLAPDILKIPEIAGNPNRITVVVMDMQNGTVSSVGQDFNILTARLSGLLARHATSQVAFVERRATTENIQRTEGAGNTDPFEEGSRNGAAPSTRIVAQYALYGKISEMRNNTTSYYYCEFKLTSISTGLIVWQNFYETKTLN